HADSGLFADSAVEAECRREPAEATSEDEDSGASLRELFFALGKMLEAGRSGVAPDKSPSEENGRQDQPDHGRRKNVAHRFASFIFTLSPGRQSSPAQVVTQPTVSLRRLRRAWITID